MEPEFTSTSTLVRYQVEKAAWHFLNIEEGVSKLIKGFQGKRVGFGSVRVEAKIGETIWKTSVFPTKEGPYCLPVKAAVRKSEGIKEGDLVEVSLKLI